MTPRILLLVFLTLFAHPTFAAEALQRSAFLGVSPADNSSGVRVEVSNLHPKGTGSAIGLANGDTIVALNGQQVDDFSHLVEQLGHTLEGAPLTLDVVRNEQPLLLTGTAQSRPKESGQGYDTVYGQFNWQNNLIRTITYHPESPRKDKASVMFIQGYTCDSIDYGMVPTITITQLLASYAQAGFTVFKMEKPGVGDSVGSLNCNNYDFDTENAAFIAGLKHLASSDRVDSDNLFVFGHSLGVLHSAIIAEKGLVKGVMGYGGVVKSWYHYLQDIYSKQATNYFGVDPAQAAANLKMVKPFLNEWLNTNKAWEKITESEIGKKALQAELLPLNGQQIFNRHYSFFRSLNRYDFKQLWSASRSHTLMMHGSYDIQAIEGRWAKQITDLVNSKNHGKGTAMSFDRTEHSLMRYGSKEVLLQAMRSGAHRPGSPANKYNPDIADASLKWMQDILSKSS